MKTNTNFDNTNVDSYECIKRTHSEYGRVGLVGAVIGALVGGVITYSVMVEPKPIEAQGFPKGFQIEHVDIKTRGDITRVKKLSTETYRDTIVDGKSGYVGNFEYEIDPPLWSSEPVDEFHSDKNGHTTRNTNYYVDIRHGVVTGSIDDKLVK